MAGESELTDTSGTAIGLLPTLALLPALGLLPANYLLPANSGLIAGSASRGSYQPTQLSDSGMCIIELSAVSLRALSAAVDVSGARRRRYVVPANGSQRITRCSALGLRN